MKYPENGWNTIKQPPGSLYCGVAVVAMVMGDNFDSILQDTLLQGLMHENPTIDNPPYLSHACEIVEYLAQHRIHAGWTLTYKEGFSMELDTQVELDLRHTPCICTVGSKNIEGALHWVLWDCQKKRIRDPDPNVGELEVRDSYKVVDIMPLTYYED